MLILLIFSFTHLCVTEAQADLARSLLAKERRDYRDEKQQEQQNGDEELRVRRRIVLVSQDVSVGVEPLEAAVAPAIETLGGRVDVSRR